MKPGNSTRGRSSEGVRHKPVVHQHRNWTTLWGQANLPANLPNVRDGAVQIMVGYHDNWLIRTDEGWKIRKMVQHITWNEGNWYVITKGGRPQRLSGKAPG